MYAAREARTKWRRFMAVYRPDRYTGPWNCPGRTRAQGPLTLTFVDGVAEVDDATLADLEPWLERNQFSTEDNRPKPPRKRAAKKPAAKGK